MQYRNFKMVDFVVYGKGCFSQLDEILTPHRKGTDPMIFIVDHFFKQHNLLQQIPLHKEDQIIFADVTHEPKTTQIDQIATQLKQQYRTVSGIIGIGGGVYHGYCQSSVFNDD